MGTLTYVVLKRVSSLMADWNVISNPEFFIFLVPKVPVNVPFLAQLALLKLKLKHHLIGKLS